MADAAARTDLSHLPILAFVVGFLLDALVVGAGFNGLYQLYRLRQLGFRVKLIEAGSELGGTWFWNHYPGAACDVMSHFYCYSFAPNPDWSRKYSPWNEIQAYAERCADTFGLRPHLELGVGVEQCRFDDASALWEVTLSDGSRQRARHVIDGRPERLAVTKALTSVRPDHPELVAARDAGVHLSPRRRGAIPRYSGP